MFDQKEFLKHIKAAVLSFDDKAEVILFGSRARGDNREDSDWDVLVLTSKKSSGSYGDPIVDALLPLELKYEQAIAPLIVERQTWDYWEIAPIHQNIRKEGIAV